MKRIVVCIFLFLLLTGCGNSQKNKKSYIEIDYATYQDKIKQKEDFALYIGSASCTACQRFQPTLEKVISDYQLVIYYIDISKLSIEQDEELWAAANIEGTPTIVFVSDGNIKLFPRVNGAVTETVLLKQLKSAGYING